MFDQDAAVRFDRVAKTTFAPVYPVLAGQIVNRTGIREGRCADVGSGPGSLALALARATDLSLWSLDLSPAMTAIATANIQNAGLRDRVFPLTGDVQSLPFADGSIDLVASRGSMFFWENKVAAFSEIYRVLRPGGWACVGGGFGTAELARKIARESKKKDRRGPPGDHDPDHYRQALDQAHIRTYDMRKDDAGFWITIPKPAGTKDRN